MVTKKLFELLQSKNISEEAIKLEHQFAQILFKQEQRGVFFDRDKAIELASHLTAEKYRLEEELKKAFPPETIETEFIPKVNNKTKGYEKGVPFIKKTVVEFNPSSRQMIAERLIKKYSWKPTELSPTGLPVINESVLESMTYEEAPLLKEYFLVTKTLGQLSDGNNAWLKLVDSDGAIHGYVDTIGAVTGRCTHNSPNLAQVPAVGGFMGKECRELFRAREGYKLVGCDASGLELRCLAHYMNDEEFAAVLSEVGQNEVELRDRYDAVYHLVTAAKGAVEFYTTANNEARIETPEQAAALPSRDSGQGRGRILYHCEQRSPY